MNWDYKQYFLFEAFDFWEMPKEEKRMCNKQTNRHNITKIYICCLTLGVHCGSGGWKSSTSLQCRSGWA